MLLAGDIGGTKALLALLDGNRIRLERRYACCDFGSFPEMLERFCADARAELGEEPEVKRACLGVAGPVKDGRATLTNLPWAIDVRDLPIRQAQLLNDFEASAHGLDRLSNADVVTLQPGAPVEGAPRLLIGAGTGLGLAIATGRGRDLRVIAGEGGHAAFAPADATQDRLLAHLRASLGRVEIEHVVSGPGLARIYAFLRGAAAPDADPAEIASAALDRGDALALSALDLFLACYGAAAGDQALAVLARGGVYLAGGVAPRLLARMRSGGFLEAFNAKGAFAGHARTFPVHVVVNERLGVLGAAAAMQP
jgi:glucokinase